MAQEIIHMQFKDAKKEGTVEYDGIRHWSGQVPTFSLKLTKPAEAEGVFSRGDIQWDLKTKTPIGVRFVSGSDISKAFNHKGDVCLSLPAEIIRFIQEKDDEVREEIRIQKVNRDFEYKLYDTDTYGIYNGISEHAIEPLVSEIKKQNNFDVFLFAYDIKCILNRDPELKAIAVDTYKPYPENENWNEETKRIYRENVAIKRAAGHGIIPNEVMRVKITQIIKDEVDKENVMKRKEEDRVNKLFEVAKETGQPQIISKGTVSCSDKHEECSCDIVQVLAMPDGTKKINQYHTW